MARGAEISLPFESNFQPKLPTLQSQVQQIVAQRGAFRDISEKSLQREIEQPKDLKAVQNEAEGANDESDEDETPQMRQEKLWKTRDEMMQKLGRAHNDVLMALDFVSLLVSNQSPAAKASMSPALKDIAPAGSLDARIVEKKQLSVAAKQQLSQVSDGWKSDSFKSASTKLSQTSSRLFEEAERQSKYWEQIAHLKNKGWAISRLPNDSRAIGVHFGFPEAAPRFRGRGFALLQQNEGGDLELDPRSRPIKRTVLRFSTIRNGEETGSFTMPTAKASTPDDIHGQISRARDMLFEEELFHEINREARLIANYGVRTQSGAVELDIASDYQLRILQVGMDSQPGGESSGVDRSLAEFSATVARLLLILEHKRAQERRSKPPPPLTLNPPVRPEYAILRPLMTQLRHKFMTEATLALCNLFSQPLEQAGLHIDVKATSPKETTTAMDNKIESLRKPANSSIIVKTMSGKEVEIKLVTYLGAPSYGTVFESSRVDFKIFDLKATSMKNLDEVRTFLTNVLTIDLAAQVESVSLTSNTRLSWSVLKPQSGEFILAEGSRKVAAVLVGVAASRVFVSALEYGSSTAQSRKKMIYAWRANDYQQVPSEEGQQSKSFKEVIDLLGQMT